MFNRKKIKRLQEWINYVERINIELRILLEREIEKNKSVCVCSAKTAEQVRPENSPESPESQNTRGAL